MSPSGERARDRLARLAALTSEPGRMTRLAYTPPMRAANDLVAGWFRAAGMTVREDPAGNLIGRLGPSAGPAVALGSHLDTVRDGGIYDGPLGIVAALGALESLAARGVTLPFPVEILCFGDEEGVRFGTTLGGSLALARGSRPGALDTRDDDGVTFADALRAFGKDPEALTRAAAQRGDYRAYLELHIEQGPVLERAGQPLGVVSGIAGAARGRITVRGRPGHAGTVPMDMRRDALAASAELILAAETLARRHDVLCTVGACNVHPGAANTIAGQVALTLDLRAMDDAARGSALRALIASAESIDARRGTVTTIDVTSSENSSPCAPALMAIIARAIRGLTSTDPIVLPSGAGHDGAHMARLCDYGMIFVRCRGGVSHDPHEHVDDADIDLSVAALEAVLCELAAREGP